MNTRVDVDCWLDSDDKAFVGPGTTMHAVRIAKRETGRGLDIYFPPGVPLGTVQAIADAINAALAKVEEPADV